MPSAFEPTIIDADSDAFSMFTDVAKTFAPCAFDAVVQNVRVDWQEAQHVVVSFVVISFLRGPIIAEEANLTRPAKIAA